MSYSNYQYMKLIDHRLTAIICFCSLLFAYDEYTHIYAAHIYISIKYCIRNMYLHSFVLCEFAVYIIRHRSSFIGGHDPALCIHKADIDIIDISIR